VSRPGFRTGQAAFAANVYVCKNDVPASSVLSMGGFYCYGAKDACTHGPNACSDKFPCVANNTVCNNASNYWCPKDTPTGAYMNADQKLCYNTFENCTRGPNVCGLDIPCVDESAGICNSGQAKGKAAWACTGSYHSNSSTVVSSAEAQVGLASASSLIVTMAVAVLRSGLI